MTGLRKMQRYARQTVFITDRVGSGPFDPALFAAVGRKLQLGPGLHLHGPLLTR